MIFWIIMYFIIGVVWLAVGLFAYWEEPDRRSALVLVTAPVWPIAVSVFVVKMFLDALGTLQEERR